MKAGLCGVCLPPKEWSVSSSENEDAEVILDGLGVRDLAVDLETEDDLCEAISVSSSETFLEDGTEVVTWEDPGVEMSERPVKEETEPPSELGSEEEDARTEEVMVVSEPRLCLRP